MVLCDIFETDHGFYRQSHAQLEADRKGRNLIGFIQFRYSVFVFPEGLLLRLCQRFRQAVLIPGQQM